MDQPQLGRFGDRRLASIGDSLLAAMQKRRSMCLHVLAEDRSQARQFHRFLDSESVSTREMLVHAGRQTAERAIGRHVLAIADTSELNYATHTGRKRGFGTVGNGEDLGVLLHPVIAVDAEQGGLIGLVGAEVINRPESLPQAKAGGRGPQAAPGRREGVAAVAGRGGDRRLGPGRGGDDHDGRGPRRRHL